MGSLLNNTVNNQQLEHCAFVIVIAGKEGNRYSQLIITKRSWKGKKGKDEREREW